MNVNKVEELVRVGIKTVIILKGVFSQDTDVKIENGFFGEQITVKKKNN